MRKFCDCTVAVARSAAAAVLVEEIALERGVASALCRQSTIQKSRNSQFALPRCPRWWLSPASPLTHHDREFAFIKLYIVYNNKYKHQVLQAIVKTAFGCFITREEALEMMNAGGRHACCPESCAKKCFRLKFRHILLLWTLFLVPPRANAMSHMLAHFTLALKTT